MAVSKEEFIELLKGAGFVKKKFFGLIKTDELDPKLKVLVDHINIDTDGDLARMLFGISRSHFNLEYKAYAKGSPTITFESDGVVYVFNVDKDKTPLQNMQDIVPKAVQSFKENSSTRNYW